MSSHPPYLCSLTFQKERKNEILIFEFSGYIFKGRKQDAEQALQRIHQDDKNYNPAQEIAVLEEARRLELEHTGKSTWSAMIRDPIERKKIIWSAGAMYSQQICGILFFYVYGVVFAQAIGIKQPFMI